jgi:hypothetical protein
MNAVIVPRVRCVATLPHLWRESKFRESTPCQHLVKQADGRSAKVFIFEKITRLITIEAGTVMPIQTDPHLSEPQREDAQGTLCTCFTPAAKGLRGFIGR